MQYPLQLHDRRGSGMVIVNGEKAARQFSQRRRQGIHDTESSSEWRTDCIDSAGRRAALAAYITGLLGERKRAANDMRCRRPASGASVVHTVQHRHPIHPAPPTPQSVSQPTVTAHSRHCQVPVHTQTCEQDVSPDPSVFPITGQAQ